MFDLCPKGRIAASPGDLLTYKSQRSEIGDDPRLGSSASSGLSHGWDASGLVEASDEGKPRRTAGATARSTSVPRHLIGRPRQAILPPSGKRLGECRSRGDKLPAGDCRGRHGPCGGRQGRRSYTRFDVHNGQRRHVGKGFEYFQTSPPSKKSRTGSTVQMRKPPESRHAFNKEQ